MFADKTRREYIFITTRTWYVIETDIVTFNKIVNQAVGVALWKSYNPSRVITRSCVNL